MGQDILQRFLSAKLFDVGGDDARLNRLREAAEDLAEVIKSAPNRCPGFAMVAMDAKVPSDEPILGEVAGILEKRWNSYAGAFANETLPVVVRAIILDALSRTLNSEAVALALTLTARTFLPYVGSQADQSLWADIVEDADRRLEQRAGRDWTMPSVAAAEAVALNVPAVAELSAPALKREYIAERVVAAAGPQDASGNAIANSNPHWPNSGQSWSNEFVPRATKAIGDSVDSIAKALVDKINAQGSGKALVEAVGTYVSQVGATLTQTTLGLERRTSLLWWKEALYSPVLKRSYRGLAPAIAAGWMAADAIEITGPFAPRMVEAFLSETLRGLDAETGTKVDAKQLFESVGSNGSSESADLRDRLALVPMEAGRTSLSSLLGRGVAIDNDLFKRRLGLPSAIKLSPIELCVWLYRDLQIARATEIRKRRGGR